MDGNGLRVEYLHKLEEAAVASSRYLPQGKSPYCVEEKQLLPDGYSKFEPVLDLTSKDFVINCDNDQWEQIIKVTFHNALCKPCMKGNIRCIRFICMHLQ